MPKLRYSEIVDQIDVDAFEAAIGFEPIEYRNDNDIGHCPDPWGLHQHGDTTGKFAIHREKKVYNCWVCGGGSLLSLAMEIFNLDVDGATEWMRGYTEEHDHRTDGEFVDYYLGLLEDTERRVATLPYFNEHVLDRFDGPLDWFHTRGISDAVIERYHLRYGEVVMKPAPVKQSGDGLVKIDEDYYGAAAIFPHYWKDRLVGWQHRWMDWDEEHTNTPKWLAKYTNTTDFPKNDTIFNYEHVLKRAGPAPVVVIESVPTSLFLESWDIPSVATFGSSVSDTQLRLLRRFQQGVILSHDNDQAQKGGAGKKWLNTLTKYLEPYIPVQHLPPVSDKPGADLGDLAKADYVAVALSEIFDAAFTPEIL